MAYPALAGFNITSKEIGRDAARRTVIITIDELSREPASCIFRNGLQTQDFYTDSVPAFCLQTGRKMPYFALFFYLPVLGVIGERP
jgi:hypothetical protein